jgi:phosphatidylserine/phosphatidylglycerophosphate/cardiolipin synthase-like enzyme
VRWSCISVWGGSSHQSETPILGVLSALLRNFYWHTVQVQLYGRAVVNVADACLQRWNYYSRTAVVQDRL